MPATRAAVAAGEITHSHARALTPRTAEAFARDEAGILVGAARKLTADQLLRQDKENRKVGPTDPGLSQQPSERRARALGELCIRAGASPKNPARRQPLVVMHTTIDTLAETGDPSEWMLDVEQAWSSVIPLDQAHLWTCDCWLAQVVIRGSDGEVLSGGRKLRVANPAMRRALVARDGNCCAVPGCDRPVGWCRAHHIIWWENGGLTGPKPTPHDDAAASDSVI